VNPPWAAHTGRPTKGHLPAGQPANPPANPWRHPHEPTANEGRTTSPPAATKRSTVTINRCCPAAAISVRPNQKMKKPKKLEKKKRNNGDEECWKL